MLIPTYKPTISDQTQGPIQLCRGWAHFAPKRQLHDAPGGIHLYLAVWNVFFPTPANLNNIVFCVLLYVFCCTESNGLHIGINIVLEPNLTIWDFGQIEATPGLWDGRMLGRTAWTRDFVILGKYDCWYVEKPKRHKQVKHRGLAWFPCVGPDGINN